MWYFAQDGHQQGPFEQEQLQALIRQGAVTASTLVWTAGMDQWLPLAETPLQALLQAAAPAAVPAAISRPPSPPQRIEPLRLLKDAYASAGSLYLPMLTFFVPGLIVSIMTAFAMKDRSAGGIVILWLISALCVIPFTAGASIFYVQKNLTQQGVTIADSIQKASQRFVQLLLVTVLLWLVLIPAVFLFILPAIYLSMRLAFVYYAVIIENRSALDAFARSMRLTKGYFWQILRAILVIGVVVGLFTGLSSAFFQDADGYVSQIVGGVVGMIVGPVFSIYYVFLFMTLVNLAVEPSGEAQSV